MVERTPLSVRRPTVSSVTPVPGPSYADALLGELDLMERRYVEILERSETYYSNPNRNGGGVFFVGAADYSWKPSTPQLEAARMGLLRDVRDWQLRFRLLFPHPTPEAAKRHQEAFTHLERWLLRKKGNDHSLLADSRAMIPQLHQTFEVLRAAKELLPTDDYGVRLLIDTNALIDNPDVAVYTSGVGTRYRVHVPPVALGELDDLKRSGRTPELRDAAKRALRRLKGYRSNGNVLTGARVAGEVSVVFEAAEPRSDGLPTWLDLNVPDDRLVASALLLQSAHPGSRVAVVTSDLNLQTKLTSVGLPFLEGPEHAAGDR